MAWLGEIRALHIIVAAAWFGAATFLTLFLMPAVRQLGPQGGAVMAALMQRRLHVFMAANAMVTVLSGGWMYWELTGGLQPSAVGSHDGVAYGLGGLAGLLAAIIGATIVGRGSQQLAALGAAGSADPARVARLQARVRTGSRAALTLMVVALLAMTLAHAV